MREDLNKLLCERERRGHRMRYKQVRRLKRFASRDPAEDSPVREGIRQRVSTTGNYKEFSENLSPLYGQVRKAVGKRYDMFYSELSQTFDKRSVINQHILTHLDQYLERKNIFVDADDVLMERNLYSPPRPLAGSTTEFYVDPRDGIIKRNKRVRTSRQRDKERAATAKKELEARYRDLGDGSVLHLIDEVWFRFTVKDAPIGRYVYDKPTDRPNLFRPNRWNPARPWERLRDYERRAVGVKRLVGERVTDLLTGEHVFSEAGKPPTKYHATKRTASHKTLKDAGLVT